MGKDVFCVFMDLEKAYDMIDRQGIWQMLRMYGVGGKLLKAVQSFCKENTTCVWVGNDVSDWFLVDGLLRRLCDVSMVVLCIYGWSGLRGECYAWERAGVAECEWWQV